MNRIGITPAAIDFEAGAAPRSPLYDDLFHPRIGALAQARHVFLGGNGLPGRWAGRDDFSILETGFGLGNNFLATWDLWRRDPQRPRRLHYVSLELHPVAAADLRRAHHQSELPELAEELDARWPPLTAGLHQLRFEAGQVRLLLALGDVQDLLRELVGRFDAFYLDGFAPARNPRMWDTRVLRALARHAAPGATMATWSVARGVRDGLQSTGFQVDLTAGIGGKREITVARWAPRFEPKGPAAAAARGPCEALVIGAGLAGGAAAAALAALGCEVTVIDRQAQPAAETSGNPGGMFHGTLHREDGIHARLFRAGALAAAASVRAAIEQRQVPGQLDGLLRLELELGVAEMRKLLEHQGLPADYVRACDTAEASALAGVPLAHPAWHYPQGGWVSPAALVDHWLNRHGVRFRGRATVDRIGHDGARWQVFDAQGSCVAAAEVLVLANAADAQRLLADLWPSSWPLRLTRGQVSTWKADGASAPALRRPVAGEGYALPLGPGWLLCGATQSDDLDLGVTMDDHLINFERLRRMTGLEPPVDRGLWTGRVGWRLQADDRLPIVGPVPEWPLARDARMDQVRLIPRRPGLYVATAFGGRGLTLAPLAGQLLAAQITGMPWPLERSLAEAMDPARWWVRAKRKASST